MLEEAISFVFRYICASSAGGRQFEKRSEESLIATIGRGIDLASSRLIDYLTR
jgi:hypothetical protein